MSLPLTGGGRRQAGPPGETRPRRWGGVRGQLGRAVGMGYPHLLASIFVVQGLAYASQLVIASLLGPADFGIVRSVEAVISIVLIVGSLGMPSLAVKTLAEEPGEARRGVLLGRVLRVAAGGGLAAALLGVLLLPPFVTRGAEGYLAELVWVVVLSALVRTSLNYYLGVRQVQRLAVMSVAGATVSLLGMVALTWWRGLDGWVLGRYLGEACTALVLLVPLRRVVRWRGEADPRHGYGPLAVQGVAVAGSLALRTAFDQSGLLALAHWGAPREAVGYFGIGTLALGVAGVFPAALAQLLVPRFAANAGRPEGVRREMLAAARLTLLLVVPLSLAGALLCGPLLRAVFPAYAPAAPILRLLLLTLPARAVAAQAGAVLLTYNRNALTCVWNAALLALTWAAFALVVPRHGGTGASWVLLLVEQLGVLLYAGSALRVLAAESRAPRPSGFAAAGPDPLAAS